MPFLRAEKQFTKGSKTAIVSVGTNLEEMGKLRVLYFGISADYQKKATNSRNLLSFFKL